MVEKIVAQLILSLILIGLFYLIVVVSNYFEKRNQGSNNSIAPEGNYPTYEELRQGILNSAIILDEESLENALPVSNFPDKILYSGMSSKERNKYESID